MKKEYVKPQNRVVIIKYKLMDETISSAGPGGFDSKQNFGDNYDDSDSSSDVWED